MFIYHYSAIESKLWIYETTWMNSPGTSAKWRKADTEEFKNRQKECIMCPDEQGKTLSIGVQATAIQTFFTELWHHSFDPRERDQLINWAALLNTGGDPSEVCSKNRHDSRSLWYPSHPGIQSGEWTSTGRTLRLKPAPSSTFITPIGSSLLFLCWTRQDGVLRCATWSVKQWARTPIRRSQGSESRGRRGRSFPLGWLDFPPQTLPFFSKCVFLLALNPAPRNPDTGAFFWVRGCPSVGNEQQSSVPEMRSPRWKGLI